MLDVRRGRTGGWNEACLSPPAATPVVLSLALATAFVLTLAAFGATVGLRRLARRGLDARAARRAQAQRAAFALHVGARAQRWWLAPTVLGGRGAAGWDALSAEDLGVRPLPACRTAARTVHGALRVVPAPMSPTLRAVAASAGFEAEADGGLLVVIAGPTPEASAATLVLGPLVQVALPAVPWNWLAELTAPAAPAPEPTAPAPVAPVPAATVRTRPAPPPQRARRWPVRPTDPARRTAPRRGPPARAPAVEDSD